ncbi:unnamed protein product [Urochloa decumbens]|uniref:F-box domain-containing protein n=1 Tax=Urochloa decumbens TaxID=240449 RepID=A0ABC8Y5Y5_9POAL
MPPRKRHRTCAPAPTPELPANLVLEILTRSDAATIFRCAATCKPLRRAILSPDFIRRVTQGPDDAAVVPSRVLGVLGDSEASFSLVHPITVASLTFADHHLAPFMSLSAAGLLEEYAPLASRRGLVVLGRRETNRRRRPSDLLQVQTRYVLLTAADGIGGCAGGFMLLAAYMSRNLDCSLRIRVQTVSSPEPDGGEWGAVKTSDHQCPWWCMRLDSYDHDDAVVLGGVVHWLMHAGAGFLESDAGGASEYILTYDVNTATVGSIDLPYGYQHAGHCAILEGSGSSSQLASSPDGKLSLIVVDHQATVSIWVLSSGGGSCWVRHWEVDMVAEWDFFHSWGVRALQSASFGDQRTGVVFLRIGGAQGRLCGVDMEDKTTFLNFFEEKTGIPCEVDLASRLSSMKAY